MMLCSFAPPLSSGQLARLTRRRMPSCARLADSIDFLIAFMKLKPMNDSEHREECTEVNPPAEEIAEAWSMSLRSDFVAGSEVTRACTQARRRICELTPPVTLAVGSFNIAPPLHPHRACTRRHALWLSCDIVVLRTRTASTDSRFCVKAKLRDGAQTMRRPRSRLHTIGEALLA